MAQRSGLGRRFCDDFLFLEIAVCVRYVDAIFFEHLWKIDGVVPLFVPEVCFANVCQHVFPLLWSEQVLDVGCVDIEDSVQLVSVPLIDDFVTFFDVEDNGFDVAVVVRIGFLHCEVFAIT